MTAQDANRAIEAVWKIESARLIAGLTQIVRDVGLAEDLAQDALVAALQQWPQSGVPDNPGAWLLTIGRRRAIDLLRRRTLLRRKEDEIGEAIETEQAIALAERAAEATDDLGDDLLRLIFITCHPCCPPTPGWP